jgi:hypothetical protein
MPLKSRIYRTFENLFVPEVENARAVRTQYEVEVQQQPPKALTGFEIRPADRCRRLEGILNTGPHFRAPLA